MLNPLDNFTHRRKREDDKFSFKILTVHDQIASTIIDARELLEAI
jgi:hypothetical protein